MTQGAALEAGIVDHLWFAADPQPAISALASYQNDDGGFGKGLELDIESPASNPFATWMGLIYLRSLPATVTEHIRMKAAAWLSENPRGGLAHRDQMGLVVVGEGDRGVGLKL
mgnify:CR=1 FL=1